MALEAAPHTPFEIVQYPSIPDSTPVSRSNSQPTSRRRPRTRPASHIPRPPNAFILFRSAFIRDQHVSASVEGNHSTLSKIIGLTWQKLSPEERHVWHERARLVGERHRQQFPEYTFRPKAPKRAGSLSSADRRSPARREQNTPEDPARYAKIASLLSAGTTGVALDLAMAEFDAARGPKAVRARFAEVVTDSSFKGPSEKPKPSRRASSEPVPGSPTEPSVEASPTRSLSAGPSTAPVTATPGGANDYFQIVDFSFPESAYQTEDWTASSESYPADYTYYQAPTPVDYTPSFDYNTSIPDYYLPQTPGQDYAYEGASLVDYAPQSAEFYGVYPQFYEQSAV
ncbi:HMG box domain-containing protein [Mycena chlorophos]|uniref:HMG box domain-containing protein n=1 Tax=Mycena chlorophos TaxID=658473 RepID=A0A8H6WKZ2_MYCCL|nr:HMG box domain-containing protein [Mycena chlorophos]